MEYIRIKGAKENNLKDISINIPRNKIVVLTGVSGSGKSSLAYDTIYSESQRKFFDTLSPYFRQFIGNIKRTNCDYISGLSPSISIDQSRSGKNNPRSTVGTLTEIYDYLRILFSSVGIPSCIKCGREVITKSTSEIFNDVFSTFKGKEIAVLSPLIKGRKGTHEKLFEEVQKKGYERIRVDNEFFNLREKIPILKRYVTHNIELVIDRLRVTYEEEERLFNSILLGLKEGKNEIIIYSYLSNADKLYSKVFSCPYCGTSIPKLTPLTFAFNSPYGSCKECDGLGYINLEEDENDTSIFRSNKKKESGILCPLCKGKRLNAIALSVRFIGKNISELSEMSVHQLFNLLKNSSFEDYEEKVINSILPTILERLDLMDKLDLGYLSLSRSVLSLSGGEFQRVKLISQLASSLSGITYILDEPSIGLHPSDNEKLLKVLERIRNMKNTLIIIEHDEQTIRNADFIIDMGPFAGRFGGEIIAKGTLKDIIKNKNSITGKYLSKELSILPSNSSFSSLFTQRRNRNFEDEKDNLIILEGATGNNLKSVNIKIPVGCLTCVTGVSGAGKSSLIIDTLYPAIFNALNKTNYNTLPFSKIEGVEKLKKVMVIDQSPIGKTSRSTPATYMGIFDKIRKLFSLLPESKMRGYSSSRFSYNLKGGRCEECKGEGSKLIQMNLLPNTRVLCPSCKGKRYNEETLLVNYKGKNISEVLNLMIDEASDFFKNIPYIKKDLDILLNLGLGYLQLGQPAPTLSSGEAQRLKLALELSKKQEGKNLYIFDEPTIGLHYYDIENLLKTIDKLLHVGNTVIIIEHNKDIIMHADWIIDLGPGSGERGGEVVFQGKLKDLFSCKDSKTGTYLKSHFF